MTALNRGLLLIFSALILCGCGEPQRGPHAGPPVEVPLIPRKVLFGNPQRAAPQISPDGKRLAYLAPLDGVMNVWVGPLDNIGAARAVTHEKKRAIRSFRWAFTGNHLIYPQDVGGNENWHIHCADVDAGTVRDLTPIDNIAAQIVHLSAASPAEILVGINDQSPQYHSLYRVHLLTGERTLVFENREFAEFVVDEQYRLRFAARLTPDGGREILRAVRPASAPSTAETDVPASAPALAWERFIKVGPEDALTTDAPVSYTHLPLLSMSG